MAVTGCLATAALALIALLLLPGLGGGFLLDDGANLKTLERIQAWGFWQGLPSVLASNPSGDLGRPIPMLTFALQHADWPDNPSAFKQVNLAIHLFNVLLVWLWARLLWDLHRPRPGPALSALPLLLALAWGVHPLLLSTVFYVVQRMALLAATCMLAGLYGYSRGRLRWAEGDRRGLVWMASALSLGMALGGLSKENALLLPGLVAIVEFSFFSRLRRPRGWGGFMILACLLPTALLLGFIAVNFNNWILPGYGIRDYGVAQRLMTEARILWDYLGLIAYPRGWRLGLFHDDYAISRGLLAPVSTLPAVVGLLCVAAAALALRRGLPAALFAIGGFLWGHALESGPIPLEPYFEHRNYLPSVFVVLGAGIGGLAWAAGRAKPPAASWPARYYALLGLALWTGYLAFVSRQESILWGNPDVQADVWAQAHPESMRANDYLAARFEAQGFIEAAARQQSKLETQDPGRVLLRAKLDCRLGKPFWLEPYQPGLNRLASMSFSRSGLSGVEQLMLLATEHSLCREYAQALIPAAASAMRSNAALDRFHYHLWVLEGRYYLGSGRPREARQAFGQGLAMRPDVELALLAVQADVAGGDLPSAQRTLALARHILSGYNLAKRQAYEKDVEAMERDLLMSGNNHAK